MTSVPFRQVDVFTAVPFLGNPVAVVLDGNGMSSGRMQVIANWTNLSETTFVCAPTDPGADYRLRIFTPRSELPFAGHPTIGSAHAVLAHGLKPKQPGRLVQECGKGLVVIHVDGARLFLELPQPRLSEVPSARRAELASSLGIAANDIRAAAVVDVGVVWITLQLTNADLVRGLRPDFARVGTLTPAGTAGITVFGLYPSGHQPQLEVRSFAPAEGILEDPVCGSGNGCVAALIRQERLLAESSYLAGQGQCMGRDGRVEVRYAAGGTIQLGGCAVTCVEGTLAAGDDERSGI